jgi:hypothetical protein
MVGGMRALGIELGLYIGLVIACWYQKSHQPYKVDDQKLSWIHLYSGFEVLISLVFWIWALYHVAHGSPDLGALSFASTLVAGVLGLRLSKKSGRTQVVWYRNMVIFGHVFVFLNFVLGTDLFTLIGSRPDDLLSVQGWW